MLTQLIQEMNDRQGAVTLRYLSKKLDVDESVVAGMIDLLVNKGIVKDHSNFQPQGTDGCAAGLQCAGCASSGKCPLVNMPKMYSLSKR